MSIRFPAAVAALLLVAGCDASPPPEVDPRPATGPDGDWAQWRGPRRDGTAPTTGLDLSWSPGEPRQVWRRPLGVGFSGIAVADGRVFTAFGERRSEFLIALDAASGDELWRLRLGRLFDDQHGSGPRSTPAVADGVVYALGGHGDLVAASVADGSERWRVDVRRRFAAGEPTWGYSSSPLIDGGRLFLHAGPVDGAVLALDAASGELAWSSARGHPGYASPLLVEAAGRRRLVSFLGGSLAALDPASGEVVWRYPWPTSYGVNAADPLFVPPDRLFISSGYDMGAALLELTGEDGVRELWTSRAMKNHFSSAVLSKGTVYGFDNAILEALDVAGGRTLWRHRGLGKGSLILAEGHLIVLSQQGRLTLVEATPEEYREKGSAQVLSGRCWTPPSLAGKWLYLRDQNEIVCLNLAS